MTEIQPGAAVSAATEGQLSEPSVPTMHGRLQGNDLLLHDTLEMVLPSHHTQKMITKEQIC